MSGGMWAMEARRVIEKVLRENPEAVTREQKERLLRDAYPFGERKRFPYRAWREEVRKALNTKRDKNGVPVFGQRLKSR